MVSNLVLRRLIRWRRSEERRKLIQNGGKGVQWVSVGDGGAGQGFLGLDTVNV